MKADAAQQSILLDLAEADAELTRLAHRRSHLPGEKERTELQARQLTLVDAVAALGIALEDLDAQVSKVDSEVAAVRQREDRDRALLDGGTVGAKELTEIQHELETLERRQSALEDSELELMERREELQGQQAEAQAGVDDIGHQLESIEHRQRNEVAEIEEAVGRSEQRRSELASTVDTALVELYERQRSSGGVGAGKLQGNKCGACRIELDRGELSRISAADIDEVLRCPECNAILVRA